VKILLAVDGSKFTRHAVNFLAQHQRMVGARPQVHLIHVRVPIPGRGAGALGRDIVHRHYRSEANRAFAPATRMLDAAGIRYREVILVGDPGTQVARYAKKEKFDLVLMGSHGHGALANLALGSVATKVLAHCKVPVLLVR
jgi:nucleotide-binding universal stress UspA family protein